MMPGAAIACACRSAIAVSCGSVLTVDRPCACRYREIISAMSSACASVDVIATTAPSKTAFIACFPTSPAMKQESLAPDKADIGRPKPAGREAARDRRPNGGCRRRGRDTAKRRWELVRHLLTRHTLAVYDEDVLLLGGNLIW